jgi:hypothetical protein
MALQIGQDYEYVGNDRWKWWVWLDGDDAELDAVEAVEYHLHPTFSDPVREVKNRSTRFRLDSSGWGVFQLNARARLTDGSVVHLTHMLELSYPDGTDDTPEGAPMPGFESVEAGGGPDRATRPDRRPSVFLSSGSADNAFASELQSSLVAHGLDVRSDYDAKPGVPLDIEIERTIGNADAVVSLSSDIPSMWVDREVSAATQLGVKVIPVAIGQDAAVPSSLASHELIQIESGKRVGEATDSILRALEE